MAAPQSSEILKSLAIKSAGLVVQGFSSKVVQTLVRTTRSWMLHMKIWRKFVLFAQQSFLSGVPSSRHFYNWCLRLVWHTTPLNKCFMHAVIHIRPPRKFLFPSRDLDHRRENSPQTGTPTDHQLPRQKIYSNSIPKRDAQASMTHKEKNHSTQNQHKNQNRKHMQMKMVDALHAHCEH